MNLDKYGNNIYVIIYSIIEKKIKDWNNRMRIYKIIVNRMRNRDLIKQEY